MNQMRELSVVEYGQAENPSAIVVLLHGVGSDQNDLIQLAPLYADVIPGALFISPNAPDPYDMAPMGYQWFSLQDRSPEALMAGVRTAGEILNNFLDAVLETHNLPPSKMVLVGFSQGTMTGLYSVMRRKQPIAGFIGYSGLLIADENTPGEITAKPPVCLIHGQQDEVVPAPLTQMAAEQLQGWGFDIKAIFRPGLGHSIDQEGIDIARDHLKKWLAR